MILNGDFFPVGSAVMEVSAHNPEDKKGPVVIRFQAKTNSFADAFIRFVPRSLAGWTVPLVRLFLMKNPNGREVQAGKLKHTTIMRKENALML